MAGEITQGRIRPAVDAPRGRDGAPAGPSSASPALRKRLSRIDFGLERWLVALCYAYFCLIILVEVARRHLFGESSQWGEMTARYAFVFLVYFAAAEVARSRDHIRIDALPRALGPRGRFCLYLYIDVLYLVLCALVVYYSLEVVGLSIQYETLMTGLDLNMAFAQAALPIGWSLLAYRVIQCFVRTCRTYRRDHQVPLGGEFGEL